MAWKRLTELGGFTVQLFNSSGVLIPEEDYASLGINMTVGADGLVDLTYTDVLAAQDLNIVCVPMEDIAGKKARVTVSDAFIEGAVGAGGIAGDMFPVYGSVVADVFTTGPGLFPGVVTAGAEENAIGITPNPWTYTDGPPPGVEHLFTAGELMGMRILPSVGS